MINDRRNGEPQGSLRVFHEQGSGWSGNWGRYGEIVRRQWFLGSKLFQAILSSCLMAHGCPLQAKEQRPIPKPIHAGIPVARWNMILAHHLQKHSCQIFLRSKFAARCWNAKRIQERYGRKHLQDLKPCVITKKVWSVYVSLVHKIRDS